MSSRIKKTFYNSEYNTQEYNDLRTFEAKLAEILTNFEAELPEKHQSLPIFLHLG